MTTMQTANDQRLRALAAEYVSINEQIEQLNERKALIVAEFRSLGKGNHNAVDWTVQVQPNRRLNAEAFEAAFPVAQHPEFYKPTINLAAVKERIAPAELDNWYSEW